MASRHSTANGFALTAAAFAAAVLLAACGSGTPSSPTAFDPNHTLPATVMLMSTGPTPREMTIAVGERVTFMNHDTVARSVAGGTGPSTPDCPEINAVGVLTPGESRNTAPFTTAKTCEYHDPRTQSTLFNGRIVVR